MIVRTEHSLAAALVDVLDDAALDALADRLAPRLAERLGREEDGWLDSKGAARYLGVTVDALNKWHRSDDPPPCRQDVRGGKRWYRKSELDAWRRNR